MNKFVFMGRLTRDPEIRYTSGENATCIANYDIAVDKRFKRRDDSNAPTADFFRITAIGKLGEFSEKYLHQGTKIVVEGRIENNNYTNKDGQKVYGFQFIAENIEFAESKKAQEESNSTMEPQEANVENFVNQGLEDSLPFK